MVFKVEAIRSHRQSPTISFSSLNIQFSEEKLSDFNVFAEYKTPPPMHFLTAIGIENYMYETYPDNFYCQTQKF